MKKNEIKLFTLIGLSLLIIILTIYLCIIPMLFSNQSFVNSILNSIGKSLNCEIGITKPVLKTSLSNKIEFKADELIIKQNNNSIFEIKNLDSQISYKNILQKKVLVDKLLLDYIFADVNKLMALVPQQEGAKPAETVITPDLYDSVLELKESKIVFSPDNKTNILLTASANIDNTQKEFRPVHFDIDTFIEKSGKKLYFGIADKDKVYIKNKSLNIDDCVLDINKSQVHINAFASRKAGMNMNLSSKKFRMEDVYNIIDSNLVIANGSEMLVFFKDMKGDFDFDINMKKTDLDGKIKLNSFSTQIIPVNNLPITLTNGEAYLNSKDIKLVNIEGYYGKSKTNGLKAEGGIKDYNKSCQSDIVITTKAKDELTKDYISPIAGIPLTLTGDAGTRIFINTIYDKIDIRWASKLAAGSDILVDGASLTPVNYDRAVNSKMHFEKNILDIESIDYYIAQTIEKGSKIKPVLSLKGKIDCNTEIPDIKEFGFDIPRPLPSEFLNLFAGEKMFKGGNFSGEVTYLNYGEYPKIKGNLKANEIRIPSQRIFIKEGEFFTDRDTLHLVSNGRFKRSKFNFKGDIFNGVKYPIVIKDVEFGLDKVDVEKLMKSMNQTTPAQPVSTSQNVEDEEEGAVDFDISNLIVEKCVLKLDKGKYKDIDFGNLNANLTLDKNSILELKAPKFNIADGISSLKVNCDLKNKKYALRLGVKDVDSEKMSSSILNISREISGKASGLIEINTDDSLKLNGKILFAVKDGTIQKIGLVEYVMKFAALFRNPLVMISPSTISDIVNIPEGRFDKISGELYLKDNVVNLLKIKSSSPQLSAYIVGMYDLENSDAILRIYTKFSNKNKGFGGFLRNISLNSLANRIPLSSRSDVNYYSSELENLPPIDADEKDCQIFVTKVDGDIEHFNFLSSLKKIK